jgi:replicative DNA helicase
MNKFENDETKLYATGIERSFIACIMKYPELATSAVAAIGEEDIYSPNYKILYKTIIRMKEHYDNKHEKYCFSQELICRWLDSADEKDKEIIESTVSRFAFLSMIQGAAGVDVESFGKYLDVIRQTSALVKTYRACVNLQNKVMDSSNIIDAQSIVLEAENAFSQIRVDDTCSAISKLGDSVVELLDDAKFNKANKGRVGIWLPKFPRLMKVLNGIRRTQFIILFARPKTGKSSLLLDIALSTASQNIPVLYIDTEMVAKEQASRALSNWSGVREWDIMGGDYIDDEVKERSIKEFSDKLKNAPLYYVSAKGGDVTKICGYMQEFVDRYVGYETLPNGAKKTRECLVVYDWLKVADSDSLKKAKEYQELGFIATSLNDMRRELDIPLIAGAQANRFGNDKEVGVDAAFNAQNFLADSDRLLRFCTCLIWLRRLNFDETNLMREYAEEHPDDAYNQMIHVVDQRGGPVCLEGIGLRFTGANLSYEEVEPVDFQKLKLGKKKRTKEEKLKELGKDIEENEYSNSSEQESDYADPF